MKRKHFTVAWSLSLLLCAATLAAWVRTEHRLETVSLTRGTRTWSVTSFAGAVRLLEIEGTPAASGVERVSQVWPAEAPLPSAGSVRPLLFGALPRPVCGFVFARIHGPALDPCAFSGPNTHLANWATARTGIAVVPYWFLCACFAVPLLKRAGATLRSAIRIRRRCCRLCGYDLRASSERCPECGRSDRHITPLDFDELSRVVFVTGGTGSADFRQ
jgi:hypothetical protein